jgi:TPR repeat protein
MQPSECTEAALVAWGRTEDERELACIGRKLTESCRLGDVRACTFAGRMALAGHGVARDVGKGVQMLTTACDDDVAEACAAAAAWLSAPDHSRAIDTASGMRERLNAEHACLGGQGDECFRVGLGFYSGSGSYPQKRALAVRAYERGCSLGNARACNNFADALTYGEGTSVDVSRAVVLYERACGLGEEIGCANLGYMMEHGRGIARDTRRARSLYAQACDAGEAYGCLHVEMMATRHPDDPNRALAAWERACDANDARACAFVGLMFLDGPDGTSRDEAKSMEAMNRACELGNRRACDWTASHSN